MATLIISDVIAEQLKKIAGRENKSTSEVLQMLIDCYTSDEQRVDFPYKFNSQYDVWSPQATEHGIAMLYQALEEYKRNKSDKEP